jgi:hypothetical protein
MKTKICATHCAVKNFNIHLSSTVDRLVDAEDRLRFDLDRGLVPQLAGRRKRRIIRWARAIFERLIPQAQDPEA